MFPLLLLLILFGLPTAISWSLLTHTSTRKSEGFISKLLVLPFIPLYMQAYTRKRLQNQLRRSLSLS